MPFKDTQEGQTHYYNDGCGEPEHNDVNKDCNCKVLSCEKNCTRNHTHKTFYCEKCDPEQCKRVYGEKTSNLNKTTQQYQKGIEEFEKKWNIPDDEGGMMRQNRQGVLLHLVTQRIKTNTLSILQSEYDRLEGENKYISNLNSKKPVELIQSAILDGRSMAITDQQTHLLETINQIKGL